MTLPNPRSWPWPKLVLVVAFVGLTVGLAIPFHLDRKNEWDDVYRRAAGVVHAGGDLYREVPLYTYPPFMAWAIIPFTFLDKMSARFLWFVVNIGSLLGMIWLAWQMVFPGGSTDHWWNKARWVIFGVGLFLGLRPGTNSVLHHQTDLPLGLFLFTGLFLAVRRWPQVGAIPIGLAAAMKCTPLLFAVYFLWRKPRLAALVLVAVALGVNLLPQLTHPAGNGELLVERWYRSVVYRLMKPTTYPGAWNVDVTTNQSLAGSVNGWMRTRWSIEEGDFKMRKATAILPPLAAKAAVYGLALLLLGTTLWLLRGKNAIDQPTAFAALLLVMLLISPMSHKTHFTLLLLPAFAIGRHLLERPSQRILVFVCCALLLQLVSLRIISLNLADIANWYGAQMGTALLLLFATWFVLEEQREVLLKASPQPDSPAGESLATNPEPAKATAPAPPETQPLPAAA